MSEPLAKIATTRGPDPFSTVMQQFAACWYSGERHPWELLAAMAGTINELVDAENARRSPPKSAVENSAPLSPSGSDK